MKVLVVDLRNLIVNKQYMCRNIYVNYMCNVKHCVASF